MIHAAQSTEAPSSCLQTESGLRIDYADPDPSQISIGDIAIGLSRAARFAGQTRHFFSVAQHSMLVQRLLPASASDELHVVALLHDAAEAYMGDLPSPLKRLLPDFKLIEDRLLRCIYTSFGLDESVPLKPEAIAIADEEAFRLENVHLRNDSIRSDHPAAALLTPMVASSAAAYYTTRLNNALQRLTATPRVSVRGPSM